MAIGFEPSTIRQLKKSPSVPKLYFPGINLPEFVINVAAAASLNKHLVVLSYTSIIFEYASTVIRTAFE